MYETLTPRENLTFAAAFILPKLSKDERSKVGVLVVCGYPPVLVSKSRARWLKMSSTS